jgi:hypothetical protein
MCHYSCHPQAIFNKGSLFYSHCGLGLPKSYWRTGHTARRRGGIWQRIEEYVLIWFLNSIALHWRVDVSVIYA